MSAAIALTLALLGPGVADEARCHWIERPLAIVPRRVVPLATLVRAPYVLTARPRPVGKRLAKPARPGFDYVCDDSGALRADGPALLPAVVEPEPVALAIAEAPQAVDEPFALPAEPTGAGRAVDTAWSPVALYVVGASPLVLDGPPMAPVPEPKTWALMAAGFVLIAFRRRRAAWGRP